MVEGLKQIRDSIRQIDEKIQEVCSRFPEYEFLLSIPGFGPDVSSKVLGAIGDPFRFQNGRQVLKMAGLDLSAERSGKTSESAIPVISKKGKADLRYALYQAAFIASIRNPGFITYYTDKLRGRQREPGIKTKMRVKLAAKLLIIAWTLMKKKEPFHPSYLRAACQSLAWADEIESSPLGLLSRGFLEIGGGRKGPSGHGLGGGPGDRDPLLIPVLTIHSTREPGHQRGGQSRTSGGTIVGLSLELWNLD
jgi:hypothetical protein